jgi:hypothetical protein
MGSGVAVAHLDSIHIPGSDANSAREAREAKEAGRRGRVY